MSGSLTNNKCVRGQFDLLLDIGCYHAVPASHRDAYIAAAAATRPRWWDPRRDYPAG